MMGHVNKTDKLHANGLATLLRFGSLPLCGCLLLPYVTSVSFGQV